MSDRVRILVDVLEHVAYGDDVSAVYRATSKSRPEMWHYVIAYKDSRGIVCSCEGFRFNGRCWHIAKVPMCLASEKVTPGRYVSPQTCTYTKDHSGVHSFERASKVVQEITEEVFKRL